jgi:GNAT superfamily N-acetyltransferase
VGVKIEILRAPSDAHHEFVETRLVAFNEATGGPGKYEPFAIALRDRKTRRRVGGLLARVYYDWLYVELIFVPEAARRGDIGTRMIAHAEAFARRKGCIGVWLTTYSFQAPGFYRKLGYQAFATLDHPRGPKHVFLRKFLDAPRAARGKSAPRDRPSKPAKRSKPSKPQRRRRLP